MPAQSIPSLDDLLRVLNRATDNERLHWNQTAEEDTFRAEMGLGMVRIGKSADDAGYVLSLLDKDGLLLDEFRPSGEGTRIAIETLYKKARTLALDLDWKLKGFYDHLKNLAGES